jgi:hypothetical protein
MRKDILEKLASEKSTPSVTISLNTHRTHPDNSMDAIAIKNHCKEAKEILEKEFANVDVNDILKKLESLSAMINVNYNLDSLHIFVSAHTLEIIKSSRPISKDVVTVSTGFRVKPLIRELNNTEEYLILLVSQSGVNLYKAVNDSILEEIENDDFPIDQSSHYDTSPKSLSDAKRADDLVREFLNKVDKALVRVHNSTGMKCVVICTEDNYSRLAQVADKPSAYYGYVAVNYNDTAPHTLAASAWTVIQGVHEQRRTDAVTELKSAVGQGKVITDLGEIYRAVKEGRGELFLAHSEFKQAVKVNGDSSIELVDDNSKPDVVDDITSDIAWEVISKNGRAMFTVGEELKSLGNVALKVRF